jgi:tetrahydromethanopterin S-methyltransferase subunit H
MDVRVLLEVDHITPKKSGGQAGHLCKLLIAKIFFYMAKTLEDTNIMRRAV